MVMDQNILLMPDCSDRCGTWKAKGLSKTHSAGKPVYCIRNSWDRSGMIPAIREKSVFDKHKSERLLFCSLHKFVKCFPENFFSGGRRVAGKFNIGNYGNVEAFFFQCGCGNKLSAVSFNPVSVYRSFDPLFRAEKIAVFILVVFPVYYS